ncbi:MAG: prepilin peptidase [Longimicrobiales bacterium]|nr:prepilin peptidase [Longimicrobiales bacterium]
MSALDLLRDVPWLAPGVAGLLGLTLGSFLNVCTLRWPLEESVISPPSTCPGCGAGIAWYDNIPVLSWILLRGRCRRCGEPISIQYPVVELTTGLIWAGMFAQAAIYGPTAGWPWEAGRGAVFLTILLGIAISDARFYIIPDEFTLGGAVLGFALALLPGGMTLTDSFVGAAVGFVLLWAVGWLGTRAFQKDAMGGGDIKMMAMVGAFLGWPGVLLTIFLGSFLGAVIFGPISWKTGKLVPFGIFLAGGAAVTYTWGDALIAWYTTQILGI